MFKSKNMLQWSRFMCSKNGYPFLFIAMGKLALNYDIRSGIHPSHKMWPPCTLENAQESQKITNQGNKKYTHTTPPFSVFVDRHSCLTSSVTRLMLQSSQHAPLTIPPFWPPNNFTHILPTGVRSYPVSHKLFSYCTNTVLSLFAWSTSVLSTVEESCPTLHQWLSLSDLALRENEYFYWYSHCCQQYCVCELYSLHTFGYIHCTPL
jgi:hypothetical protein